MLNLFLALLLSSFGASNLSAGGGGDNDTSKLSEAFNRIGRFRRWVKNSVVRSLIYVKDRIIECCRRQISGRRGEFKKTFNFHARAHFYDFMPLFSSFLLSFSPFIFPYFCTQSLLRLILLPQLMTCQMRKMLTKITLVLTVRAYSRKIIEFCFVFLVFDTF